MLQQAVLLIAVCMLLHSRIASCSKSIFLKRVLLLLSLSSCSQTFSLVSHFSQITTPPSPMVPNAGQGTGGHKVGSQLLPLCVWHSLMSKFLRHVLVFKASANACAQAASSIFYNSMWFCTRIFQWSHCPAFIILWNFLLLTSPCRVGITPRRVWSPTHMRWCSHRPDLLILRNSSVLTSPFTVGITPMREWLPTHMRWSSHRPALRVRITPT